jgi:hypothetical protein
MFLLKTPVCNGYFLAFVALVFSFAGCGKQVSKEEKRTKFLNKVTADYDRIHHYYQQETSMVSSITHENQIDADKREAIINCVASKRYKKSAWDALVEDPFHNAPLHKYKQYLGNDIATLKYDCRRLQKYIPDLEIEGMVGKLQVLINELYFIDTIVMSDREYRDESRYLSMRQNSFGAQRK